MYYMNALHFSGRPAPAPDGLFGRRRPRLLPEASARRRSMPPAADAPPPRPLTPFELGQIARTWRRRADGQSIRVAEALELVAALRMPAPQPFEATPSAPVSESVVKRISKFMGL